MSFFEYKDTEITFDEVDNAEKNKLFRDFINKYHSYVKYKDVPQRRVNWLIWNGMDLIGCIGFSSCVLAVGDRDRWIGWTKEQRQTLSNSMANNYRFCLKPDTGIKNLGSRVLKIARNKLAIRWKEKYGDDLLLLETYVLKNENRRGAVYLADNWTHVGNTTGVSISKAPTKHWLGEKSARGDLARLDIKAAIQKYGPKDENGIGQHYSVKESQPKMIFVKPIIKEWKERIQKGLGIE
jgi:hypothetical protein